MNLGILIQFSVIYMRSLNHKLQCWKYAQEGVQPTDNTVTQPQTGQGSLPDPGGIHSIFPELLYSYNQDVLHQM